MSVIHLLSRLKELQVGIRLENDRLKLNVPDGLEGTLSSDFLNQLKENREAIIHFLRNIQKEPGYTGIEPAEKKDYYPLSAAQQRLYIVQQLELRGTGYNIPGVMILEGTFQIKKAEATFRQVIQKHESLRTSFRQLEGTPVQQIHEYAEVEFSIEYYDSSEVEVKVEEEEGTTIKNFIRPFDLSRGPLLRVGLIKTGENRHILTADMHHIISDGTSMGIFVKEFMALYAGEQLSPLEIRYTDYSEWQNRQKTTAAVKKQEAYWLKVFNGEIPVLNLPTDYARPPMQSFEGRTVSFEVDREETRALKELAKAEESTLYMVLLALFYVFLVKLTGQDDIVVGTPEAGRRHPDTQHLIGMLVNTLALRNFPIGQKTFKEFLGEVRTGTLEAFENLDYQFEDLVDRVVVSRDTSRNPLFDVKFVLQNLENPAIDIPGLTLKPYHYENKTSKFDLSLDGVEVEKKLVFILEYAARLFKKGTIRRFITYFKTIISTVLQNPYQKISAVEIITGKDKAQILHDFNNTVAPFPAGKTIHQLFAEQVKKSRDHTAVIVKNESITYQRLESRANRLADYLHAGRNIQPDERVDILMERSINLIAALLGILKAGGAYVPIEPSLPEERIKKMIDEAEIAVVISEKKQIRRLNRLQWDCKSLHTIMCMDSMDIFTEEEEEKNALMDEKLWRFVGETASDEITGGGWLSSYTGEPFTKKEMAEYAENILKKLTPLLHRRMRVLEIGCASGITMFAAASKVGFYYGTDLSEVIIRKNKEKVKEKRYQNIALTCLPAHHIDTIKEKDFHLVIINSVIHCFHGHNYLRRVIAKAIHMLGSKGHIFIGDILDRDLKEALIQELVEFKQANRGKNYKTKTDFSAELFVSRSFFEDLARDIPEIRQLEFSRKIYTLENELTKFRYDALLSIEKNLKDADRRELKGEKQKHQHDLKVLQAYSMEKPAVKVTPGNLAYVIYTSGSTGTPKGVMIEHQSVVNRLNWMQRFYPLGEKDVILQKTPIGFDVSVWELFWWFFPGASLYLLGPGDEKDPEALVEAIETQGITTMHFVPSMLNAFLDYINIRQSVNLPRLSSLRQVFSSGEALEVYHVEAFNNSLGKTCKTKLVNLYGPTEAAVDVSYYNCSAKKSRKNIPIGKPIDNIRLYIVNREFYLQPVGIPGELCIFGVGLARGYLNRPELTAEKFCLRRPGGRFLKKLPPWTPRKNFSLFPSPVTRHPSPLYKTGDLARWLSDGNIEFLGRIDNQVKIRGSRVELGEVENRLLKLDGIEQAVVVCREDKSGDKYICAYIVSHQELDVLELRTHFSGELPGYMIPSYFVRVESFPFTSSGKVNRKALPEPEKSASDTYVAPINKVQEKLAEIWAEVLHMDKQRLSIDDNFFMSGGHSLKANLVISKIHQQFDVNVPLVELFKTPSIRGLADYIQRAGEDKHIPIEAVEEKEWYALSFAQKRLYFLHQLSPTSTQYNLPAFFLLEGELKKERLENSFRKLIERHEGFRTSFHLVDDKPVQRIHDEVEFKIQYYYLATEDTEEVRKSNPQLATSTIKDFIRPFDLSEAPLLRGGLVQIREQMHILMVEMHHITADGTSTGILIKDFAALYVNRELAPLGIRYKDYSQWQMSTKEQESLRSQEMFWKKEFKGEIPLLRLPTDYPRPVVMSFEGKSPDFEIGAETAEALYLLAMRESATLFIVLFALFTVLLSKLSGQEDIVVGTPLEGRRHENLRQIVGMFVNTLALRNYPTGSKTFPEFLNHLKEKTLAAFENQAYPFEELVEKVAITRDTSRNPLFDVMFAMQNFELPRIEIPGLNLLPYENRDLHPISKFDLTLQAVERDRRLLFTFEYNTALFKETTVKRFIKYFKNLIFGVLEDMNASLSEIEIISGEEKSQLLYDFNDTAVEYPEYKTIPELFAQQVEKTPDHTAVSIKDKQLTYRQLKKNANGLAHQLRDQGIKPDSIVGIIVKRSLEMVVGIMGILKAGGAYLPIEPEYPEERIRFMLENSESKILLTPGKYTQTVAFAGEMMAVPLGMYDNGNGNLEHINKPGDLLYLIYTSGSTGRPKGVMVKIKGFMNLLNWYTEEFNINALDNFLLMASFSFDLAQKNLFSPLIKGARLCLPFCGLHHYDELSDLIEREQITMTNCAPSVFYPLVEFNLDSDFKKLESLREVFLGGESIQADKLLPWINSESCAGEIVNTYGPTECTDTVSFYRVSKEEMNQRQNIPIGRPIHNVKLFILDKNQLMLPVGIAGELCIGGISLAKGYYNNEQLTEEKFIEVVHLPGRKVYRTGDLTRWLPDGNIEFLGRIDHQVKIRGFRIEPGEIESQLLKHEDIKEAVVLVRQDENKNKYLCAFIITDRETGGTKLRDYLSIHLPDYMIPSYFMQIEKIPLTSNGKIDRKGFPDLEVKPDAKYSAPTNEVEEKLMELWSEILGIKKEVTGIDANFFEWGGHSLKATMLVSKIHKELRVKVPLAEIFRNSTIRKLAGFIKRNVENSHVSIEPVEKKEYYALSSAQKRLYILQKMDRHRTAYNMPAVIPVFLQVGREKFEETIKQLFLRHESFRTSFHVVENEVVQKVHSGAEIEIEYYEKRSSGRPAQQGQENNRKEISDIIKHFVKPFDLSQAPLARFGLITLSQYNHLFMLDFHHIISDGTSQQIVNRDFILLYHGRQLPGLRLRYRDFSEWCNTGKQQERIKSQEAYWLKRFEDEIPVLELRTDYPRPQRWSFSGANISVEIESKITKQLKHIASQEGKTLFMVLLAALNVLLARYTTQEDIIIGSVTAGRGHPGLEDIIGFLLNTLAIRNYPYAHKSFKEFVQEVKINSLNAFENQDYPFQNLMEKLAIERPTNRNPLFDVMFILQNFEKNSLGGLEKENNTLEFISYEHENKTSKFDLTLYGSEKDETLVLTFEYCTELFKDKTIRRMIKDYTKILESITQNLDIKIKDIQLESNVKTLKKACLDVSFNI